MKGVAWTDAEVELVREQRRRGVQWPDVVPPPGRTHAAAMQQFHIVERKARAALIAAAASPADPQVAPARPRYFAGDNVLLLARVAAQGVTAGLLGDPPPGRSALDKKRAGLAP